MRNLAAGFLIATFLGFAADAASAQSLKRAGTEFNALRSVAVPPGKAAICVTQFLHHGEVAEDGGNVLVFSKNQKPVPTRVLQVGPGDLCRVAFQLTQGPGVYEILYGGKAPGKDAVPAWESRDGLLLETREYKSCNLNSLESVRRTFEESKPFGADYVSAVEHSANPFSLRPGPFMSRYTGWMRIATAGTYGFLTSSQDASFLLVDDKLVVDAPGRHQPVRRARPESRKDIPLSAGMHKFEYYHVATGPETLMVAAWEINPTDPKPAPKPIPPDTFNAAAIVRAEAGPPTTRGERIVPDFHFAINGCVALPDNDEYLVSVRFADNTPKNITTGARYQWEFGDGQTSDRSNPTHIYLHPGTYAVKLTVTRAGKPFEVTNRIYVDHPLITDASNLHRLEDYLPVVENYDPRTLDAASLRQLVLAYEAKADSIIANAEEALAKADESSETPGLIDLEKHRKAMVVPRSEAKKFISAAVEMGRAALVEPSQSKGDEELVKLGRVVGRMARDQVGDANLAGKIWYGVAEKVTRGELKAECLIEAADIAVNDLNNPTLAKQFLESAARLAGSSAPAALLARLKRVSGDLSAVTADGAAARKAYQEAQKLVVSSNNLAQQIAQQGARGRSTEQFLKTEEYARAIAEIRQWQDEFPADKIDGYITLLHARYWHGRDKYPQAIALLGQLSAVNPDSPYIDQLMVLASECHVEMNAADKAIATLQSLLKSYPGSPLVPEVKQRLKDLESGAVKKKPRRPVRTES